MTEKDKIIAYLEWRIKRLEEDRPTIRDDFPPNKKLIDAMDTRTWIIHHAAKSELQAAIRGIRGNKH